MASEVVKRKLKDFGGSLWSMKNEKKFCDAAIIVDGQRIEVHAAILASSSEFFENAFKNSDPAVKEVSFKDVDTETLLALVEYCYTGRITITESNIYKVFKMAKCLLMKEIIVKSSKVLKKILNVENSLSMLKIVKSSNSKILMSIVLDFIRKNFEEVSLLQNFFDLEYSDMKVLLSKDVDVSGITVYEVLKKWVKHDISRTDNFVELLDQIQLDHSVRDSMNDNGVKKCSDNYNTLIAVGDDGDEVSKIIEILDLSKSEWIEIQYDELKKENFSAVLLQDKLMVIGGFERKSLSNIEYYNLYTGKTELVLSMKYPRYYSSAVEHGEFVYVIGGYDDGYALRYVERWSQSSKTWTTVASLAKSRCRFGVAILGNEIFAVGGEGDSGAMAYVEAYNPKINKWRKITPMNEKREDHGVAEVNGFLYAVGGCNRAISLITSERYDPNIKKWTMIQSIEVPKCGLVAGNLNGQLLITGGWANCDKVPTVEKWQKTTDEWKSMPPLKNSRFRHNLLQIPWSLAKDVLLKRVPK